MKDIAKMPNAININPSRERNTDDAVSIIMKTCLNRVGAIAKTKPSKTATEARPKKIFSITLFCFPSCM